MDSYLKSYTLKIKTLSPIHIGDGDRYEKSAYVRNGNQIQVFNNVGLYRLLYTKGIIAEYETFSAKSEKSGLSEFFSSSSVNINECIGFADRAIDIGDEGERPTNPVLTIIRDAYGNPYIPASSIKGALRTIVESALIMNKPDIEKTLNIPEEIKRQKRNKSFLLQQDRQLSSKILHSRITDSFSQNRDDLDNAKNDIFKGVIISDSSPLSNEDICVCKISNAKSTALKAEEAPQFAECIKPNTEIEFTITFDTTVTNHVALTADQRKYLTIDGIFEAIQLSYENYRKKYGDGFQVGTKRLDHEAGIRNIFHLGKYSGFAAKTEIYSLYDKNTGKKIAYDILDGKGSLSSNIPNLIRVAKYKGKNYQIGRCELIRT